MASPTTPVHGKFGAIYGLRTTATAGSLTAEACTESGTMAQITDSTKRFLDPNNPPVFTDSGGEQVLWINYTSGTANFSGNVGIVTVTGVDSYFPTTELEKVGYVTDWSFNVSLDMADQSYMGEEWKTSVIGQAGATGSASSFFIGADAFIDGIISSDLFLLQLFTYDPGKDQTGDHFNTWVRFNSNAVAGAVGDLVKDAIDFTSQGIPSFTEDV